MARGLRRPLTPTPECEIPAKLRFSPSNDITGGKLSRNDERRTTISSPRRGWKHENSQPSEQGQAPSTRAHVPRNGRQGLLGASATGTSAAHPARHPPELSSAPSPTLPQLERASTQPRRDASNRPPPSLSANPLLPGPTRAPRNGSAASSSSPPPAAPSTSSTATSTHRALAAPSAPSGRASSWRSTTSSTSARSR